MDDDTVAVVLTHRRPRLATALVRNLIEVEGFAPGRIVLVVDRDGGLEDPRLERQLHLLRLTENGGPAAGFDAGLQAAFERPAARFAYLCEDDVLLEGVHTPRVRSLRDETARHLAEGRRIGAVVAYGRVFRPHRGGTTLPYSPDPRGPRFQHVDAAAWGATLVSREVWEAGVRPDPALFFGFEDFDFFFRVRAAGFEVLVDRDSGAAPVEASTRPDEDVSSQQAGHRPSFDEEPWRAFYVARNFCTLARRHGSVSWLAWHLVLSARRIQLARDRRARRAVLAGLWAGLRGRLGRDERYVRDIGEWEKTNPA